MQSRTWGNLEAGRHVPLLYGQRRSHVPNADGSVLGIPFCTDTASLFDAGSNDSVQQQRSYKIFEHRQMVVPTHVVARQGSNSILRCTRRDGRANYRVTSQKTRDEFGTKRLFFDYSLINLIHVHSSAVAIP
jgi:hypothetical protein